MKKIIWEIQFHTSLPVLKYCRKCGKKTEFASSEQFRINAQRHDLDIWLLYKCRACEATWKATIYSRVAPDALSVGQLDCFHRNDKTLARQYAMNGNFLRKNGVAVGLPVYSIIGECFSPEEEVELEIKSEYPLPVKVSSLIKEKLHLSQKEYSALVDYGRIKSTTEQDLRKCRLNNGSKIIWKQIDMETP